MPTLSPDSSDFNVSVEAPVSTPSALGSLADVVSGFANEYARYRNSVGGQGETLAQARRERDRINALNLDRALLRGFHEIRALRDAGRESEALTMENNVLSNYMAEGGDPSDGSVQTAAMSILGRELEDFGRTAQEIAVQEVENSEDFQVSLLGTFASHPDATQEERTEIALGNIAVRQARSDIIANAQFGWSSSAESAFMDSITDFENTLYGGVFVQAEQGGDISLEDAQQASQAFRLFRGQLEAQRPANVSDEEWGTVRSRLDRTQQTIDYFEELSTPGNVSARALSELQRAVQNAEGITDFQRNLTLTLLKSGEVLQEFGPQSIEDMRIALEATQMEMDGGELQDTIRDPSLPPVNPSTNIEDMTSDEVFKSLNGIITGVSFARNINQEETRNAWGAAVSVGMSDLSSLAERGEWLSGEQYTRLFSNDFFNRMDQLKSLDPGLHSSISARAQQALTRTGFALQRRLNSVVAGSAFSLDRDNQWVVNTDSLSSFLPPALADQVITAAVDEFGGSQNEALASLQAARGFSRHPELNTAWYTIQGHLDAEGEEAQQLTNSILVIGELQDRLNSGRIVNDNKSTGGLGDKSLQEGASSLLSLMDRTEGGGNYDTLFGHSQRFNGEFQGVRVSEMTIGELSQFSSTSGQYGQWVKGQVGRVATPMGRYQIVGTTLRETAERMNLGPDTVFTPEVQDAMFHHLATQALSGKTSQEAKRAAMRATWEGFGSVPDSELDRAIAQFEGSPVPNPTITTRPSEDLSQGVGSNILASAREGSMRREEDLGAGSGRGRVEDAPTASPRPPQRVSEGVEFRSSRTGEPNTQETGGAEGKTASQVASKQVKDLLLSHDLDLDQVIAFDTEEEALNAVERGEVEEGSVVLVDGQPLIVESSN